MSNKGVASILATLIAVAISVALSGAFIQVSKELSKDISESDILNPQAILEGNTIRIYNPYPTSVALKDIKLIINGEIVKIRDENNNGIWDPFETITFNIPADNFIEISLLYKNVQIYYAIYIKPELLRGDVAFPALTVPRKIEEGSTSLNIQVEDDLVVKSIEVYYGYLNGSEILVRQKDCLSKLSSSELRQLAEDLEKFAKKGVKTDLLKKCARDNLELKFSSLEDLQREGVIYILVKVTDLSGKISQKVVQLPTSKPWVDINLSCGYDLNSGKYIAWTTANSTTVLYNVTATDNYGLKSVFVKLGNSLLISEEFNETPKMYNYFGSLTLTIGNYIISAIARNIFNVSSSAKAYLEVKRDYPPNVTILSPEDNSTVDKTIKIIAKVTDDRGVSKVVFYVDSSKIAEFNASENNLYETTTTLSAGEHVIKVVAYDIAGQSGEDSVTVVIDSNPTIEILKPEDGSIVNTTSDSVEIEISVRAIDDIGVTRIVIYVDEAGYTAYNGAPFKLLTTSIKVKVAEGKHTIKAVAYDTANQTGSDISNIIVRKVSPPTVTIVYPNNLETFVPGDPVIVAISRDKVKHTTTITLSGRQLKSISTEIAGNDTFSTGWVLISGDSSLYVPNLGLDGEGRVTISIERAYDYSATYTFKPIVKKGIADSKGVKFIVDVPTSARVKVLFSSIIGVASTAVILDDYPHKWYHRKVFAFSAPEGAKIIKAVATGWARTKESVSWFTFYAIITEKPSAIYWGPDSLEGGYGYIHPPKGAVLASKKGILLSADLYYQKKYKTSDRATVHLEIPEDKAIQLLNGKLLEVIAEEPWCEGCEDYSGISGARISYCTEVKRPAIYVDDKLVTGVDRLDVNTMSASKEFTIGPGRHTITLKSDYGAFKYRIIIVPEPKASNPTLIRVTTPWGKTYTLKPEESISYAASLDNIFGTFKFDVSPDYAKYLVMIEYQLNKCESSVESFNESNKPIIKIIQPEESTFEANPLAQIPIKAIIEDDTGLKSVRITAYLSGTRYMQVLGSVTLPSPRVYTLEKTVYLRPGSWKIVITACNVAGNVARAEIAVNVRG